MSKRQSYAKNHDRIEDSVDEIFLPNDICSNEMFKPIPEEKKKTDSILLS